MFLCVIYPMTNKILFENADVGPYHPPVSFPIERQGEILIEQNLEGLTMNIPYAFIDDILRHYQHHIVNVFASIGRLIHIVARAVACYREQHP